MATLQVKRTHIASEIKLSSLTLRKRQETRSSERMQPQFDEFAIKVII